MKARPLDTRPAYVVVFCLLLFSPQLLALALQIQGGFRPFRVPPKRVAFSWDMFAVNVLRCETRWDPKISVGARTIDLAYELAPPFEWWPTVYDRAELYAGAAEAGCALGAKSFELNCFESDGKIDARTFPCR